MTESIVPFDSTLVGRYDRSGPRYTSYPPVSHFGTDFTETDYKREARGSTRSLSLYIHIPFCAHVCLYCACNKIVTGNKQRAVDYLHYLEREIALQAPLFRGRQVDQLHLGGGTPTYLDARQMEHLLRMIRTHFDLAPDAEGEYSIEIDPRTVDRQYMHELRRMGFNRISIGVQDFDERVQKAVNRVQTEAQTELVVDAARSTGVRSINMDLIYGLPYQCEASFARTLETVIAFAPDRLSVFNYAHLPEVFKMQRLIATQALPAPDEKLRILGATISRLTASGYRYIGMDHFAKSHDELAVAQQSGGLWRNFQGYSTHADHDVVGFGPSALSQVGACYAQNTKAMGTYCSALSGGHLAINRGRLLNDDDIVRRTIIMQLICHMRLDIRAIEQQYRLCFKDLFAPELAVLSTMARDGLLTLTEDSIVIHPVGRLFVRNVCMVFDRYLLSETGVQYSRTV